MCDDICMDMCYEYFSRYRKQRLTLGDDGFITMSWFSLNPYTGLCTWYVDCFFTICRCTLHSSPRERAFDSGTCCHLAATSIKRRLVNVVCSQYVLEKQVRGRIEQFKMHLGEQKQTLSLNTRNRRKYFGHFATFTTVIRYWECYCADEILNAVMNCRVAFLRCHDNASFRVSHCLCKTLYW